MENKAQINGLIIMLLILMGLPRLLNARINHFAFDQQLPYTTGLEVSTPLIFTLDTTEKDTTFFLQMDSVRIRWNHLLQSEFRSDVNNWKSRKDLHELIYRAEVPKRWPVYLIVLLFFSIALVRQFFPTLWNRHLNVLVGNRGLRTYLRFQTEEVSSFGIYIALFSSFAYAITLREILWRNQLGLTDYISGDLILLTFLLFLAYIFKLFLFTIGGYIYNSSSFAGVWVSITVSINLLVSLLILPFSALMHLQLLEINALWIIRIAVIMLGVIWLYRMIRMMLQDSSRFNAGVFYLFLYFCSLEIGPMLFVLKFVELKLK